MDKIKKEIDNIGHGCTRIVGIKEYLVTFWAETFDIFIAKTGQKFTGLTKENLLNTIKKTREVPK